MFGRYLQELVPHWPSDLCMECPVSIVLYSIYVHTHGICIKAVRYCMCNLYIINWQIHMIMNSINRTCTILRLHYNMILLHEFKYQRSMYGEGV